MHGEHAIKDNRWVNTLNDSIAFLNWKVDFREKVVRRQRFFREDLLNELVCLHLQIKMILFLWE